MTSAHNHPWKSFTDQLELLKSRGMSVTDEPAAISYLERIGYYRLSAYWYPFRIFEHSQGVESGRLHSSRTDAFVANTQFTDALALYLFDKQLRLLVLDALERVEVAIRVDISHLLGERDVFAHQNSTQLHTNASRRKNPKTGKTVFMSWNDHYQGLLARSKEDFVKHYKKEHAGQLPIWVACELWDFGTMSRLFAMMKVQDQLAISQKYGIHDHQVLASWLRSMNYLRNLVAHHCRVWNRNVIDQPKLPKAGAYSADMEWVESFRGKSELVAKPFLLLAITHQLLKVICPNSSLNERIKNHILGFPSIQSDRQVSAIDMGIPESWVSWW